MILIKQNLLDRLQLQAKEAQIQGLEKVAHSLNQQINNSTSVEIQPAYDKQELSADLNHLMWEGFLRIASFYDLSSFDAGDIQEIIDAHAENFYQEIVQKYGPIHGISALEEPVMGQRKIASDELTEDEIEVIIEE